MTVLDPLTGRAPKLRLRDEGVARRTEAGLRRLERLRPLPARRQRRHFRVLRVVYDNYGNAAKGVYCDADGNIVRNADGTPKVDKRRPRDYAWITTPRYRFRYDGRWLMTQVHISPDGGKTYGPDLVDRWKARAFAQDPGSETPCCGFEEEDTNWGGSSTLLGERVRAGAHDPRDLGRRLGHERDPPRDLLPRRDAPEDLSARPRDPAARRHLRPVGLQRRRDDDVLQLSPERTSHGRRRRRGQRRDVRRQPGRPVQPATTTAATTRPSTQGYRSALRRSLARSATSTDALPPERRPGRPDVRDATRRSAGARPRASTARSSTAIQIDKVTDLSPGGAAQSMAAVPYYRDDSCFDDGTGTDPGPKLHLRSGDEPRTLAGRHAAQVLAAGGRRPRRVGPLLPGLDRHARPAPAVPGRLRQRAPDGPAHRDRRPTGGMVMLPGRHRRNEGEQYGRGFEKPLVAVVGDARPMVHPGQYRYGDSNPGFRRERAAS